MPPSPSNRGTRRRREPNAPPKQPKKERLYLWFVFFLGAAAVLLIVSAVHSTHHQQHHDGQQPKDRLHQSLGGFFNRTGRGLVLDEKVATDRQTFPDMRPAPRIPPKSGGSLVAMTKSTVAAREISGGARPPLALATNTSRLRAWISADPSHPLPNSCDRLLGPAALEDHPTTDCLVHGVLKWAVCPLPPLRLHPERMGPLSFGNDSVASVVGRTEEEERIVWKKGMVELAGEIPSIQKQASQMEEVQLFLGDEMVVASSTIQVVGDDDDGILTVFVFRETYANPEWGVTLLFQTYTVLRSMKPTEDYRIIFMDGHAATATDDAWVKLFGPRVFYLRNFVNETGITTFGRSIVVQPVPTALGNEAVVFYKMQETCRGQSFLVDFRHDVLEAYGLPTGNDEESPVNRTVTLLYSRPFLVHPRSKLPKEPPVEVDMHLTVQQVKSVYPQETGDIAVVSLDDLPLRGQLEVLSSTGLLLAPDTGYNIMSLFLPPRSHFEQFGLRGSKRMNYLLHTLGISYAASHMPTALQETKLFGTAASRPGKAGKPPPVPKVSCDVLLGWDAIQSNGTCRTHTQLMWTICEMPPVRFLVEKIAGAAGNESVHEVLGRGEAEERLSFQDNAVETIGHVDPNMVVSCPKFEEIQELWKKINVLPPNSTFDVTPVDTTPTIFVFRETYANPCWSIIMAYQTWLVSKAHNFGGDFRILWMDGHAYTGMDDFWRDFFGPEVHHFQSFVRKTNITAFNRSVIAHAGRLALGNEALKMYEYKQSCTPNSTLHEFRRAVLDKYGYADNDSRTRAQKRLTFLVRRPYMAHPRSVGLMDRTIHDLNETISALYKRYPRHDINVVSFEGISFREQLAIVVETDLLIAVHGAGNIHVLFLPLHATFIEFYPKAMSGRKRFQYIAHALNISRTSMKADVHKKQGDIVEMSLSEHIIMGLPDD
jgi:hypothetical protein